MYDIRKVHENYAHNVCAILEPNDKREQERNNPDERDRGERRREKEEGEDLNIAFVSHHTRNHVAAIFGDQII